MQQKITLRLLPSEAADHFSIITKAAAELARQSHEISGYHILKKSLDARGRAIFYQLTLLVFISEPFKKRELHPVHFKSLSPAAKRVLIIGAGPAGLFAALKLLEAGIQPILLERGKDVKARRRDLALLNKSGILNPESNYCFGEGGAGTYSDGKLYTRSNKRGNIDRILGLFVQYGAPENILYDAHPHIGTNKLPAIITAMRQCIIDCGGEVLFDKKVVDIITEGDAVNCLKTEDGSEYKADDYILATGHSARDIFELLHNKQIQLEAKPFALGVRIEHPQSLIDNLQYHCSTKQDHLPPAAYSLVHQVDDTGVFSFCMCPGGIIAPASTEQGALVVNGWSPSKRNNPYANSGMVVQVTAENAYHATRHLNVSEKDPLLFIYFQKMIEQRAFEAGGGFFTAPALRMTDFCDKKISSSLPANSYHPGLKAADLQTVFPSFIYEPLVSGFRVFGKKMRGFYTQDAVVVATESRTSSPVRIPRDTSTLNHPQLCNLFPCGEGAGYAGGIVSAAMDGENIAAKIIEKHIG